MFDLISVLQDTYIYNIYYININILKYYYKEKKTRNQKNLFP